MKEFIKKLKKNVKEFIYKVTKWYFSEFPLTICDKEFKLYHRGSKPGTYGVIAFKDVVSGHIELGRSVKLHEYLSSINRSRIKEGCYGRGPRDMKNLKVFYLEVENKDDVSKVYFHLNKHLYKKVQ